MPALTCPTCKLSLDEDVSTQVMTAVAVSEGPVFDGPVIGNVFCDTHELYMSLFESKTPRYAVVRMDDFRFRLDRKIAHGRWSRVYAVHDLVSQDSFALKVVPQKGISAQGFESDLAILRRLQHPNIVRYHEDFTTTIQRIPFRCVKMELCAKGTLRHLIEKRRFKSTKLSSTTIRHYLHQIAEALAFVHDNGMLHGDIRPDNILLTSNDVVKLSGFGSTTRILRNRSAGEELTVTGGSRVYAPPEWKHSVQPHRPLGPLETPLPAYDMWGVGCVLAEMATMRLVRGDRVQTQQSLASDPNALQDMLDDMATAHKGQFQSLVVRLLAEDPDDRLDATALLMEVRQTPVERSSCFTSPVSLLRRLQGKVPKP